MSTELPLLTQPLDTATPLRQANQDRMANEQHAQNSAIRQQQQRMNEQQILQQHYEGLDAREKSRMTSVISGAVQLESFLNNGDLEGAHNFLMQRRNAVQNRIAAGENLDTEDTDAALQMLRTGNVEELYNNIQGLKAAGQVYGIINKSDMPSNVREWQYYNSLSPEQQEQYLTMKRSNQVINLGDRSVVPSQTNPAGPAQATFEQGITPDNLPENVREREKAAIEGRKEGEKSANFGKARSALIQLKNQSDLVTNTIDEALNLVGPVSTGWGALLSKLPNSDARALRNSLDTIKANVGFDKLQAMRDASPTGGALGQVSEMENRLLQAVNGALDPMQEDQLVRNLQIIKDLYPKVLAEREEAFQRDYGEQSNNQLPYNSQNTNQPTTVRIKDPKTGRTGTIPREQLQAAQQQGYEVIE